MNTKHTTPLRMTHKLLLATMLFSSPACGPSESDTHDAKLALEKARADMKAAKVAEAKAAHEANPCPGKWFFDLHVVCPAQDNPNLNVRCMTESERRYAMLPGTGGTRYHGQNGRAFSVPVKLDATGSFASRGWRTSKEKCDESRERLDKRPDTMANSECVCLDGPDTRTGFWPKG